MSAFANTEGGTILLGVSDKKEVKGIDLSKGKQETLINKITHSLGIQPRIEAIEDEGGTILSIAVEKSSNPISYKAIYYTRIGNTTRAVTPSELRKIMLNGVSWESQTGEYSLDEIKEETVREFVRLGINEERLPESLAKENIESILKRLDLMNKWKINRMQQFCYLVKILKNIL